jgi:indole-3-glycerol phosphate synthase
MENILDRIVGSIQRREGAKFASFDPLTFRLKDRKKPIAILPLLDRNFFLIAEVKKGSPSRGIICPDYDPVVLALAYQQGGASAISVITESQYFLGFKKDLSAVRAQVDLPLLRKDFLIHPFQIYESFNLGADFVLLIVSCLTQEKLKELIATARSLAMGVLVEVRDEEEIERALQAEAPLLGINNRDLKTFAVDSDHALRMRELIPAAIPVIAESGIQSHEQIEKLKSAGFAGALIGEYLLRQKQPEKALRELIHG